MIINKEKLVGCIQEIYNLAIFLEKFAEEKGTTLIVSSGKRNGNNRSWHNSGRAIDFYFKDSNMFKYVTEFYYLCFYQKDCFKGITEFEVCRGGGINHFHLAFGNEGILETFTGVYSG